MNKEPMRLVTAGAAYTHAVMEYDKKKILNACKA